MVRFASATWLASAFTLFFAATLPAQVISINFNGEGAGSPAQRPGPYDLLPSETAGALPRANWNNVPSQNATTSNLITSTGAATPASVTVVRNNAWSLPDSNGTNVIPFDANGTMMRGYLDTGNATTTSITVSGLPAPFSNTPYSVWVYFDGDNAGNQRVGQFTIGGRTIFGRDAANESFNGTFVQVPSTSITNQQANTPAGNYMIFPLITGSSFTLTATPAFSSDATLRAPINAIQIEVTPIPEPGSLTLLGVVAASGWWARRRSKR
jgi:hypothetical protein